MVEKKKMKTVLSDNINGKMKSKLVLNLKPENIYQGIVMAEILGKPKAIKRK